MADFALRSSDALRWGAGDGAAPNGKDSGILVWNVYGHLCYEHAWRQALELLFGAVNPCFRADRADQGAEFGI